jgi:hypothetical protein
LIEEIIMAEKEPAIATFPPAAKPEPPPARIRIMPDIPPTKNPVKPVDAEVYLREGGVAYSQGDTAAGQELLAASAEPGETVLLMTSASVETVELMAAEGSSDSLELG